MPELVTSDQSSEPAAVPVRKPWVLKNLRPLPQIAAELFNMVSDDRVGFGKIADKVKLDPAFSAQVLTLANSPLLGARATVNNVLHAIALLGLERLKSMVMMVALRNLLSHAHRNAALERCWRHSLACAFLAEAIVPASCWTEKAQCYTAGLMHDIGRLALLADHPTEYDHVLEIFNQTGCDVLDCERKIFGVDHHELGRQLMVEWNLPPLFADVAGRYPGDPRDAFDPRTVVSLACELSNLLGFQVAGPPPTEGAELICAKFPEPLRRRVGAEDELLQLVSVKINALETSFAS